MSCHNLRVSLTTTEFIARHIHNEVKKAVTGHFSGRIKVRLGESHEAWAAYEAGRPV